jgi:hypothetical protein
MIFQIVVVFLPRKRSSSNSRKIQKKTFQIPLEIPPGKALLLIYVVTVGPHEKNPKKDQ